MLAEGMYDFGEFRPAELDARLANQNTFCVFWPKPSYCGAIAQKRSNIFGVGVERVQK